MFQIKEIIQKQDWEDFLTSCEGKTFLNSWNWGEFQKMMGCKIWRFGIYSDELSATVLVIKIQAKRGVFLFVPHGPIMSVNSGVEIDVLRVLLSRLKEIAKEQNASFIRIASCFENSDENIKIFKDLGFRVSPTHMHPEITWELDISPTEDELLMNMRKTTRYLIRQAEKNKDVEIVKSQDINDIEKFNELYQATVNRHHFTPFSLKYLKNEFLAFNLDNQVCIFSGKYKGEIVASAVMIFWQGIGFYHQGASSLKYPKIPVSYLLQWEAIKEAKKRGCNLYNFWGTAPLVMIDNQLRVVNKKHPWSGLTLFKMGFGGYKKEYAGTYDFVLSSRYWLNYIIETVRKARRGL